MNIDNLSEKELLKLLVKGQASLEAGQSKLEAKIASLEVGQAKLEAGQAKLEAKITSLEQGQAKLEVGQASLEEGQKILVSRVNSLENSMSDITENFLVTTYVEDFKKKEVEI